MDKSYKTYFIKRLKIGVDGFGLSRGVFFFLSSGGKSSEETSGILK